MSAKTKKRTLTWRHFKGTVDKFFFCRELGLQIQFRKQGKERLISRGLHLNQPRLFVLLLSYIDSWYCRLFLFPYLNSSSAMRFLLAI